MRSIQPKGCIFLKHIMCVIEDENIIALKYLQRANNVMQFDHKEVTVLFWAVPIPHTGSTG